jgi:hypothetical protein
MLTLEWLVTSPLAFNITTATPVQRACCRLMQGVPLGELAQDDAVVRSLGGREATDEVERALLAGRRPLEVYIVGAIRSGKSLMAGAGALYWALTLPIPPKMARTDEGWVTITSVSVEAARVVGQHVLGALERSPVLKYLLCAEPAPSLGNFVIRRPDGYRVRIIIRAGRKGGSNLVSRWNFASIFDEASRMQGQDEGVINYEEAYRAVSARLGAIGAPLIVVTSPWRASGPIYKAVQENWGHPTDSRVVVRAPGPDLNPVLWTPEACERERLKPDGAYETDVLGEFADPESGFLTATETKVATRASPTVLLSEPGIEYTAGMDPATQSNAWTLVVVGRWPSDEGEEERDRYRIAFAHQWQGTSSEPLRAREVFAEMASMLKAYRLDDVHTDRWGGSLIVEAGDQCGLTVRQAKPTSEQQAHQYANFRTLLLDGRLELPPVPQLIADLLSTRKRLLPGGGVKYEPPMTRDGRHGDFAPASVLAVAHAQSGITSFDRLERWRRRGGVL